MAERMKKIYLIIFLVTLLIGCGKATNYIKINNNVIEVELAKTPQEKGIGLMYREYLEEDSGMLFIFDGEKTRTFWMKNTLIPLDIFFIDSNNNIVDIQTIQPCKNDPCASYKSKEAAMYALEVNAGFAEKLNITVGDKVNFN